MINNKRYVNRDVESIRKELYEYIKSQADGWTDFNSDTFESHIIDIVAGVSDMICYYIDQAVAETQLSTARQEKNIRGILSTMNYPLETVGSARGTVTVERLTTSLGTLSGGRLTIPKWSRIEENEENYYLTTEACTLLPSDEVKEIPVVQGERIVKSIKSKILKKDYKYYLVSDADIKAPIDLVYIDDPTWEKVSDAFCEVEGGKKYSVHKDSRGRVYILFTYDWRDYLPVSDDETVDLMYIKTNGTEGLVGAYALSKFADNITDDEGTPIGSVVTVYNKERTYGAFDDVDLNLHKANAKNSIKTMDRIILRDDFEAKIREQPWILDCTVYDWRRDYTIVPEPHKMVAWVVTTDGVDTSEVLISSLRDELMKITVEMTDLEIRGAEFVNVPIRMDVCVKGNNDYRERVRAQIEDAIKEAYSVKNLKFGQVITASDIEDVATRVSSSVRFPEVTSFTEPFSLTAIQFPNITEVEVRLVGDIYGQKTDN